MDLDALFRRIDYTEGGTDTERLKRLHRAFALHIPYENLDAYNHEPISLKPEDLFDKIVTRRRGGYCYEMNGFFCAVLREMGFSAYGVATRLSRGGEPFGAPTHRLNIAEADGVKYICDVGFGMECFVEPLRLELGTVQRIHGMEYRVVPSADPCAEYTVEVLREAGFQPCMGFIDRPAREEDFTVLNYYTSQYPHSPFRMMFILNRFTETGRFTLFNLSLTCRDGEITESRTVKWGDLPRVLRECFGLDCLPNRKPEPPRMP